MITGSAKAKRFSLGHKINPKETASVMGPGSASTKGKSPGGRRWSTFDASALEDFDSPTLPLRECDEIDPFAEIRLLEQSVSALRTASRQSGSFRACLADNALQPASEKTGKKGLRDTLTDLKLKFANSLFNGTRREYNRALLEQICFFLARISSEEMLAEVPKINYFERQQLKLTIKSLGNKSFKLHIPPPAGGMFFGITGSFEAVGTGNAEEQGTGGSCDRFIGMLPESCRIISKKACPLGLVPKLLPYGKISKEARYVGSCFWIWLCIVDDLTEKLLGRKWDETESDLNRAFSRGSPADDGYYRPESDVVKVTHALRTVIDSTKLGNIQDPEYSEENENLWRATFKSAVLEVLVGFREERPLLANEKKTALAHWMRVRVITISVRPFMVLARACLGLPVILSSFGNPLDENYGTFISESEKSEVDTLTKVECLLQLVMGLQNDILGWEKDAKTGNSLNAIQILIKRGVKPSSALKDVVDLHNELSKRLINYAENEWITHNHSVPRPRGSGCQSTSKSNEHRRHVSDGGQLLTPYSLGIFWFDRPSSYKSQFSRKDSVFSQHQVTTEEGNKAKYLELILGFANGMATWMAVSKRYIA